MGAKAGRKGAVTVSNCCCNEHSTEASHRIWGEGVIGNSPKSDPSVARCCKDHGPAWVKPYKSTKMKRAWVNTKLKIKKMRIAWTILKLKVTRGILAVLLRVHLWHELRNQRKVQPSHMVGQRTREEVREAVRRIKKKRK